MTRVEKILAERGRALNFSLARETPEISPAKFHSDDVALHCGGSDWLLLARENSKPSNNHGNVRVES